MTNDDTSVGEETDDRQSAIAMVATSSQRLPDITVIKRALGLRSSLVSRLFSKVGKYNEAEQWDKGVMMLEYEGAQIIVMLMPFPIPWSDLEGPCATAWWWPEATDVMQKHQYHFVVMVTGGEWNEVARRLLLAKVMQGVVESTDSVGVYWGDATLVMQPGFFVDNVAEATTDDVPMMVFADVRVEEVSEDVYRCFTTGMKSLGFHEIEMDEATMEPDELLEFVLDTAKYIVDENLEIPEGNTFGRDDDKQFVVRYRPSMFDRDVVMKLDRNPNR
jgi:hypothetical protein